MRRSRQPQRTPHPDPVTENRLQQVLAIRAQASAAAKLAEDYRDAIDTLHSRATWGDTTNTTRAAYYKRADELHDKIRQLTADISQMHEDAAQVMASMSPADLAYL
jgi:uncharacterized coiled-coil DUF342 family protein